MNYKEYAVAVLIDSPEGIPLIRDPKKPVPIFWKLPGGRSKIGESAQEAAIREIKEEIGLTLKLKDFKILKEENRGSHNLVIFKASLSSLDGIRVQGNEGEEIRVFPLEQIKKMKDFFPNHQRLLSEINYF